MKKLLKIIIILLILTALSFGGYKLYWYIRIKYAKIEVELNEDLTIEFTKNVKASSFIKSINGKITNDYLIDSTKVGKQDVVIKFKNDDGIPVKYKFEVEVVDTVKPIVWIGSSYRVKKGEKFNYNKIMCGDNYDKRPKCYIEGKYDTNKVGSYPLTFIAEDSSGNTTAEEFVLNVYEPTPVTANDNKNQDNSNEMVNFTRYDKTYDKYKTNTNKIGIDVSKWQGDIDFEALKNDRVEFVIIRVGYTKGPNGEYILDPKFKDNIEGATKNNIPVGLYFYSYADSVEHAIKDAKWVVDQIKDYKIDLPIAFDWEEWKDFNEYNISFYELTRMGESFIDTVEKAGYKGMLYSSKSYLEYIWLPTNKDIWLAHYTDKTTYKGKYKFWQLCDDGKVDGIKGHVDVDIMYE